MIGGSSLQRISFISAESAPKRTQALSRDLASPTDHFNYLESLFQLHAPPKPVVRVYAAETWLNASTNHCSQRLWRRRRRSKVPVGGYRCNRPIRQSPKESTDPPRHASGATSCLTAQVEGRRRTSWHQHTPAHTGARSNPL